MIRRIVPIQSGKEYTQSRKGWNLKIYLFGKIIKEPVKRPTIRLSINTVAKAYYLAYRMEFV